jgi:hypothetical protein
VRPNAEAIKASETRMENVKKINENQRIGLMQELEKVVKDPKKMELVGKLE